MKNLKLLAFVLVGLLVLPKVFEAQTRVLQTPEKYVMPTENVEPPQPNDVLSDRPWFVFSDRSENPVYATSESYEKRSELGFGEAYVALELKNNRLLLAKPKDISQGTVLPGKTPIGWVDQNNLLLWHHCLITGHCKLNKKALVLNVFDSDTSIMRGQTPKFFSGAGARFDTLGDAGTGIAKIYFVYKETEDFLLLGKSSSFEESAFNDVVVGWIPKRYCSIWNSNLALEINWNPEAASERENALNNAMVWENEADAAACNKEGKLLFREYPMYRDRKHGFDNRFLILDHPVSNEENLLNQPIKVGVIGKVTSMDEGLIDLEKIYRLFDGLEKKKNINILFVIDASRSMEVYSVAVANALRKAMQVIDEKSNASASIDQNQYSFGAVLFRDEAEVQVLQRFGSHLSKNVDELGHWLQANMIPEYNRNDTDIREALYYGMQEAMEFYHPNPEETNYMIVVGDAGDHQNPEKTSTFIEEEQIVDDLAKYNMNMLAYQVRRAPIQSVDNPYQDFENQLKRIMLDAANKNQTTTNYLESGVINFESSGNNSFKLNSQSPVTGEIVIVTPDAAMTVQQLESNLTDAIQRIDKLTSEHRKKIEEVLEGSSNSDESSAKVIYGLMNSGINSQDISIIFSGLHQTYQEGYTLLKPANANFPWYQHVILIERNDLKNLQNKLRDLISIKDYPKAMMGDKLIQVWGQLFRICFGNLMSNAEPQQLSARDLSMCMTCLPGKAKFSNLKFSDLHNPAVVSYMEINEFIMDFEKTLHAITKIIERGSDYPHVEFPGNSNQIYYWVPVEIFPHD